MNSTLEKYLKKDERAFYEIDGKMKFRGVRGYFKDTVRNDMANAQVKHPPCSVSTVFSYVNDFLESVRSDNGFPVKNVRCGSIEFDGISEMVLDNGIIAKNLEWKDCIYSERLNQYTYWDEKYDVIASYFKLISPSDIVWLKFTKQGHLGVVARSFDINYRDDVSSGILVNQIEEAWDKSYVLIFPLTKDILGDYSSDDLELAIGNYLISKGVPIIDYFSHNN